jgi:hypothetical protein
LINNYLWFGTLINDVDGAREYGGGAALCCIFACRYNSCSMQWRLYVRFFRRKR